MLAFFAAPLLLLAFFLAESAHILPFTSLDGNVALGLKAQADIINEKRKNDDNIADLDAKDRLAFDQFISLFGIEEGRQRAMSSLRVQCDVKFSEGNSVPR